MIEHKRAFREEGDHPVHVMLGNVEHCITDESARDLLEQLEAALMPSLPEPTVREAKLANALQRMLLLVEKAGGWRAVADGVECGAVSWSVKMADVNEDAVEALADGPEIAGSWWLAERDGRVFARRYDAERWVETGCETLPEARDEATSMFGPRWAPEKGERT